MLLELTQYLIKITLKVFKDLKVTINIRHFLFTENIGEQNKKV